MSYVACLLSKNNVIVLIAAINPYKKIRNELIEKYQAKTILIDCDINTLSKRDTKGLYKRAFLPQNHPYVFRRKCLTKNQFHITFELQYFYHLLIL